MLSVVELANRLGCSRRTVLRYATMGERRGGITYRISDNGRKVFIGKDVLDFWRRYWGIALKRRKD